MEAGTPHDSLEIEVVDPTEGPQRVADKRTEHIIEMMKRKEFVRGRTVRLLAKQWGISHSACERYAVEAGKFLRLIREPEAVRDHVLHRLHEIGSQDKPDRVPALLGAAKMAGVLEPPEGVQMTREQRVAHTVAALSDPDDELYEAMIAAKKAIYRLLFAAPKKEPK
jgi:hypothetical protein